MPATTTKPLARNHSAVRGLTLLYEAASRNQDMGRSRDELKAFTRSEREHHAPPALRGSALEIFLNHGLTFSEQRENAELARTLSTITVNTTSQEDTMPSTLSTESKPAARKRGSQDTKTTRTEKRSTQVTLTASQVAQAASIDGKAFRKFLRSQDVRKGGIKDKRHAASLVKAFTKAQAA